MYVSPGKTETGRHCDDFQECPLWTKRQWIYWPVIIYRQGLCVGHENRATLLIGGKYRVWGFEECVRLCVFLADSHGQVQFPHLHRVDKSISLADSLEG